MTVCVAYDLTRLFVGPTRATPRGIDRVELGYARHFLSEWPGQSVATLPTPAGVRVIARDTAVRVIDTAERCWGEDADPDDDPLLREFGLRLQGAADNAKPIRRRAPAARWMSGLGRIVRQTGCLMGPLARDALPPDSVYLNLGQLGFALPGFVGWLRQRPDIAAVFMLHDIIPLEHPHFVPVSSTYFHRQMVKNVAAHASAVIATTKAAGAAIRCELQKYRCAELPMLTAPLPVSPAFLRQPPPVPALAAVPYFVVVGSVEPRKNHRVLLEAWRMLMQLEGRSCPKLVIAGTRWTGHEATIAMLDKNAQLRAHVVEIGGLSTPSLLRVLAQARALLMPSFAEGFGLPIVEAMALGLPVIASDIPAHREAGGDHATYLDPHDAGAWLEAIRALTHGANDTAPGRDRPSTWPAYLSRVEDFLAELQGRRTGFATERRRAEA